MVLTQTHTSDSKLPSLLPLAEYQVLYGVLPYGETCHAPNLLLHVSTVKVPVNLSAKTLNNNNNNNMELYTN